MRQQSFQQTEAVGGAETCEGQSLEALVQVLDNELAATLKRHQQKPIEDGSDTPELMIRFSVNGFLFAVTADQMVEVEAVPLLTFVPQVSPAVCGLANLRGEAIVVIDMARTLDQGDRRISDPQTRRMIVVRDACLGRHGGIIVDRVFGMGPLDRQRMSPPSGTLPESVAPFVVGNVSAEEQDLAVIDLQAFAKSAEAGTPWSGE